MAVEPGLLFIPLVIVLSGAIALIGNAVGRGIGRRRLSLYGLRPRHTAQVITVATGMLIAVTTLVVVLALSREARVALFRLNEVLRETQRLEAEIRRQEDRLNQLALGDLAYLSNQEVLREVIDGRAPSAAIRRRVADVAARAAALARETGIGEDGAGNAIVLTPPNLTWEIVADLIDRRDSETVLRLVASQNTLKGEPLAVFVQLFGNRLVYRAGTTLARGSVAAGGSRERIGQELLRLADQAAVAARGRVLAPPFTLVTTLPTATVDVDNHRAAITQVQRAGGQVAVQVTAARDIFTVGPLLVRFRVGR